MASSSAADADQVLLTGNPLKGGGVLLNPALTKLRPRKAVLDSVLIELVGNLNFPLLLFPLLEWVALRLVVQRVFYWRVQKEKLV